MSDINNQFDVIQKQFGEFIEHLKDWVNNEFDWIEMDADFELNRAYEALGGRNVSN